MKWSIYGVFFGTKWALTTNKKQALAAAKKHQGYVTRMPYDSSRGPWDAPTFKVCSTLVADFTPDQKVTAFYAGS